MRRFTPTLIVLATVAQAALAPTAAFATDYLSAEEAQKLMFADASALTPISVSLSPEQTAAIQARAHGLLNTHFWNVWKVTRGDANLGYFATDAVIGKFQLINYAVGFSADGSIKDIEILAYRESHGAEVRTDSWRKQFVGKTAKASLAIGDDIANISGATLSCTHLTEGIRRLTVYIELLAGQTFESGAR
ncbi:MAG: FMN-binding protein [Burkholderiaceae bacterium]|jgi:Na+-translocating ferredoxin:NAD+ oxidoreductase RnfG subunit